MLLRRFCLPAALVLLDPTGAFAAGGPLNLPVWSVAPFVLLLLAIAILPLVAGHFWHSNFNRFLVSALFALPTIGFLYWHQQSTGEDTMSPLAHEMGQYVSFILLLGALYTVAGGVLIRGDILPTPTANTLIMALGCVIGNAIGTTGASVLLIRPLLRTNRHRQYTRHLPVFFIFTVCNLGGLLTPLGDPPLFLGFLNGVPFTWTLRLAPQWLVANACVLFIFFVWDSIAFRCEAPEARDRQRLGQDVLRVEGKYNFLLLGGMIAAVLLQGQLEQHGELIGGAAIFLIGFLSWLLTPRSLRQANQFSWAPIVEVAVLFAGIFVTMVPALEILSANRDAFGIDQPWQYFWMTGALSSLLDNAPTYLSFATMAAGSQDFSLLVKDAVPGIDGPLVLAAISCGAVFMGANTYIGNGPNFVVKAIADEAGYKTPSFFGYMAYSVAILLPVFALVTWIFFW